MCNFTRVGIILDQRCLWQISRLSPIWKSEWREAITLAGSNCRISSLHKSAIFAANMEPCKTGHKMAWNDRNIFKLGILQPVEAAAVRVGVFRAWKGGLERLPTSSLLCHPLKGSSGTCVKVYSDATNPKHKSLKGLVGSPQFASGSLSLVEKIRFCCSPTLMMSEGLGGWWRLQWMVREKIVALNFQWWAIFGWIW